MAHYAFLDENNIITEVIVGKDEDDGVDWEAFYAAKQGLPASQCRRTSYNTINGVHTLGEEPYRHHYAGVGYSFDPDWGDDGGFFPPLDAAE